MPERLLGDRYRIEHVIGNFVSNAIKFSPDYGSDVVVDVSVEQNRVGERQLMMSMMKEIMSLKCS